MKDDHLLATVNCVKCGQALAQFDLGGVSQLWRMTVLAQLNNVRPAHLPGECPKPSRRVDDPPCPHGFGHDVVCVQCSKKPQGRKPK